MSETNGAQAMVRMLQAHGVSHVFGLCGDTSLPFYDALATLDHGITHVLARDERSAGYMADGYARVTGRVGVCEGPSGGGATYILPALVEANESSIAVLAITTDVAVASRGRYTLTELDQRSLFRPLTKWNAMLDRAADVPRVVRAAFTAMTSGRPGAAHIGFPYDVQTGAVDPDDVWADEAHGRYPAHRVGPDPDALRRAAAIIAAARSPIVVCGGGVNVSGAHAALAAFARAIDAPVATTVSGQGAIEEDDALAVGVVGANGGTPHTREAIDAADLVIFVGCRAGSVTTERWRHPARGRAPIVHIDVDPMVIGANYRADAAIVGDARLVLEALVAELPARAGGRASGELRARLADLKERKRREFLEHAHREQAPVTPERLVLELERALPPGSVVVADPGTPCPYLSAYYPIRETGRTVLSNRAHGALGWSLPAAIGVQCGAPSRKVVSVMGDGSFGFTVGELETALRLRLPITFIVVSNATFGWIKAGQRSGFGSRYFSVDFSRTDHAAVARAYGVRAWRVESPHQLAPALREAVAADGPTLVDVVTQPLHEAHAPVSEWVA